MDIRDLRQGFLPPDFLENKRNFKIGVIGLGGGGSPIVQGCAQIGFANYLLVDPKFSERKHLNRVVGMTLEDVKNSTPKVDVAKRLIEGLVENPTVTTFKKRWQKIVHERCLKECDIIFAALDDFANRRQLEQFCRDNKIPLIDIGLKVAKDGNGFKMFGQIVLSRPGGLCFRCYNFCMDHDLETETRGYGVQEDRFQLGPADGVLANSAVLLGIDLLSNWNNSGSQIEFYKHFDGNSLEMSDHILIQEGIHLETTCNHY